jgi:hypothetical protein
MKLTLMVDACGKKFLSSTAFSKAIRAATPAVENADMANTLYRKTTRGFSLGFGGVSSTIRGRDSIESVYM